MPSRRNRVSNPKDRLVVRGPGSSPAGPARVGVAPIIGGVAPVGIAGPTVTGPNMDVLQPAKRTPVATAATLGAKSAKGPQARKPGGPPAQAPPIQGPGGLGPNPVPTPVSPWRGRGPIGNQPGRKGR